MDGLSLVSVEVAYSLTRHQPWAPWMARSLIRKSDGTRQYAACRGPNRDIVVDGMVDFLSGPDVFGVPMRAKVLEMLGAMEPDS